MGNKLCAPLLKKNYRQNDTNVWYARKDSHLLRLWADVFQMYGEGEYMRWERVSDDVVPVNISCIEDTPMTVFHVTAYNRHVERIFDVKIQQPGTLLCPATECFVHWRDLSCCCEWGLNFSTPTDSQRFRDCCSFPTQSFARKASSISSLQLSTPKIQESRPTSTSSPNSPVRQGHHMIQEVGQDGGCEHTKGLIVVSASKSNSQSLVSETFTEDPHCGNGSTGGGRDGGGATSGHVTSHSSDFIYQKVKVVEDSHVTVLSSIRSRNPAFSRSFPSEKQLEFCNFISLSLPKLSEHVTIRPSNDKNHPSETITKTEKANTASNTEGDSPKNSTKIENVLDTEAKPTFTELETEKPKTASTEHINLSDVVNISNVASTTMPGQDKPISVLKNENKSDTDKMLHTKQTSDCCDIIHISHTMEISLEKDTNQMSHTNQTSVENDINQIYLESTTSHMSYTNPAFHEHNTEIQTRCTTLPQHLPLEKLPEKTSCSNLRVDSVLTKPKLGHASSSESVEWPPPPEPLTPPLSLSPSAQDHISFDSDTIRKMLQPLPASPVDNNYSHNFDKNLQQQNNKSESSFSKDNHYKNHHPVPGQARLSQAKSVSVQDRRTQSFCCRQQSVDLPRSSDSSKMFLTSRSRMFNQLALEKELKKRNKSISVYSESGLAISGDTSPSKNSEERSAFFRHGVDTDRSKPCDQNETGTSGHETESEQIMVCDLSEDDKVIDDSFSTMTNACPQNPHIGAIMTSTCPQNPHIEDIVTNTCPQNPHTGAIMTDTCPQNHCIGISARGPQNPHIETIMTDTGSQNHLIEAVVKAGWLVVKNWLLQKKNKLELAPHRAWKRYWVDMNGTTLMLFDTDDENCLTTCISKHIILIEGGIAHPVPEHSKRDNVFSLSTAFGDAYLFQASSQADLENWMTSIHLACASSYARQNGRDNTLKLLSTELQQLESSVEADEKMHKMAELQLSVVTDLKSRQEIIKQITQLEENLEKLYIDQYQLGCYTASLQGTELPDAKILLANASRTSKATLGRLGVFTVTSFHALVCARSPPVSPNIYSARNQKAEMLSSRRFGKNEKSTFSDSAGSLLDNVSEVTNQLDNASEVTSQLDIASEVTSKLENASKVTSKLDNASIVTSQLDNASEENNQEHECISKVTLSDSQCYNFYTLLLGVNKATTVQDLLEVTCNKWQLNERDHYVRIKPHGSMDHTFVVPDKHEIVKHLRYDAIEVCQKCVFQLELTKPSKTAMFGFVVKAELGEDVDKNEELRLFVCDVSKGGIAATKGLMVGDEILVINGKIVSELDMLFIVALLQQSQTLFLTVRSTRTQPTCSDLARRDTDAYIDMVILPPPTQTRLSEKSIGSLIVPAPEQVDESVYTSSRDAVSQSQLPAEIDLLLQRAKEVTAICRKNDIIDVSTEEGNSLNRILSDAMRLRKAIMELVETERAYVKDLKCVTDHYLEPLKQEAFLTSGEIEQLFGNIQEIVAFQQRFLLSLEEAVESVPEFYRTNNVVHFKKVLCSIGGSFLYYANHFKVYSSFCASHSRSQKILNPDTNEALREFLKAKNPKQQHSATLESYLIKPIQRILKYPLLLQQLCNMTHSCTNEHHHLSEALKGMEAVAEHINEMQKIYDDYGSVFDELAKSYKESKQHKTPIELNVGELQMYGTVEWVNITDFLGKVKKSSEFENTIFVFKAGVTFLCRERLKRKKAKSVSIKSSMTDISETMERYQILIPTQEVQIRSGRVGDLEQHYWWDLIHSRSEVEGRPEKVFQFCNSTSEAKSDFMKVIRQVIRESVRKMIIPTLSYSSHPHYYPHTSHGRQSSSSTTSHLSTTLSDSKGSEVGGIKCFSSPSPKPPPIRSPRMALFQRRMKSLDIERHSENIDNNVTELGIDRNIQTRRKTVGDLNDANIDEPEGFVPTIFEQGEADGSKESSSCSSNSNISCSSLTGNPSVSAKLQFASADPLHYSSFSENSNPRATSPVWKKVELKSCQPDEEEIVEKNYEDNINNSVDAILPLRQQTKTVVFATIFGNMPFLKDTEC